MIYIGWNMGPCYATLNTRLEKEINISIIPHVLELIHPEPYHISHTQIADEISTMTSTVNNLIRNKRQTMRMETSYRTLAVSIALLTVG